MQQRAWTASLDDLFFPLIYRKGLFLPGRQTGTFLLCSGSINWKHKLIRTHRKSLCCCCLVAKSCPTLLRPRGLQLASSSVHGISQARTLEWVAISFSRGPTSPRDRTQSCCIGRRFLYRWANRKVPTKKNRKNQIEDIHNHHLIYTATNLPVLRLLKKFNLKKNKEDKGHQALKA